MTDQEREQRILESNLKSIAVLFRACIRNHMPDFENHVFFISFNPSLKFEPLTVSIDRATGRSKLVLSCHDENVWEDETDTYNALYDAPNKHSQIHEEAQSDGFTVGYPPTASEGGESDGE